MTQQQAGRRGAARPGDADGYPGAALGLPRQGSGAMSGTGRRIAALFIDWLACTFIVVALIRPHRADVEYWTLAVFALQDVLLTALTGLTLGKRLTGIRVTRLDGKFVGAWALLRTLLLLTAIAPLLVDRDLRGLHDRAANTAVVRL